MALIKPLVLITAWILALSDGGSSFLSGNASGATRESEGNSTQLVAFQAPLRSQFDLSNTTIPLGEIFSGGPPKDGIPALTNPKLIAARKATYLRAEDRVIGFVYENDARAYPLRILNHHEIVNDQVGQLPIAVSYCPLCDSAAVFDRRTPLGVREFGVSGLLYNSNVLLYDRGGRPESLWSQIMTRGISGSARNKSLKTLPVELTTWKAWLTRHPKTSVLSQKTGHRRNYGQNPYASYFSSPRLMFPAKPTSQRLPAKSKVLGVWTETMSRAYPVAAFGRRKRIVEDNLGGRQITIEFNPEANSLRVVGADPGVQWLYSLWFAWYAFHPDTEVY